MTNLESYHAFLIKHRVYCDRCDSRLIPAVTVENVNGRDEVLCGVHSQRLKAARKSDKVFEEQETKRTATVPRIEMEL